MIAVFCFIIALICWYVWSQVKWEVYFGLGVIFLLLAFSYSFFKEKKK